MKNKQLRTYLMLWSTQSLSALGSGMTSYALVLWLYLRSGSALKTALFAFAGMDMVIIVDLFTFSLAFLTLLLFIHIPESHESSQAEEKLLTAAHEGLLWLRKNPLIFTLIMYLSCINLVASVYDAALPAMILSKQNGGETILGIVNTCVGIATLTGSVLVTVFPAPKNRVKAISVCLLLSMSSENFLLAFGKNPLLWCVGAVLGWLSIPIMNANLDVIFRSSIPIGMQGRVYSCRNTLQFFTIPIGFLLGGLLVDSIFEPLMAAQPSSGLLTSLFGVGKGSGAAMLFFVIGLTGVVVCLIFNSMLKKYRWSDNFAMSEDI